jgi:chemotaxis protein histidine kinase CheA
VSRVRSFFLTEADECLATLREELEGGAADPLRAHGAARLLRGSAQMARYGALARQAETLERTLKPLARGDADWTPEVTATARRQLAALTRVVEAVRTGKVEADSTMEAPMDGEPEEEPGIVPLGDLEYSGNGALERAIELRPALEETLAAGEPVDPLLDELFDLVRLGMR